MILETQPFVKLNDGVRMPQVGLGTYQGENMKELVVSAIKIGYRHFDTAAFYKNEEVLGEAISASLETVENLKRSDLFIVTKLWLEDFHDVEGALKTSLKKLKLDYVDLYLMHWTVPLERDPNNSDNVRPAKIPLYKTWAKMEEMKKKGLAKSIGVSNFCVQILLDMLAYCEIPPSMNQIEVHPYFPQVDLVKFCQNNGIHVTAYAPLGGKGVKNRDAILEKEVLDEPLIIGLAIKYNKTPSQIILNYHLCRGIVVIPKTSNVDRLKENFGCFGDFRLLEDEVEELNRLDTGKRKCDPKLWKEWGYLPLFC